MDMAILSRRRLAEPWGGSVDAQFPDRARHDVTDLRRPRLSGLGRNPGTPDELLVRLAEFPAGRHGIAIRRGLLADDVVEALLTHGGADAAVRLDDERVSPEMRARIADHPDLAVRHARADFAREMLELQIPIDVVEADLDSPDPRRRAAAVRAFPDRTEEVQERLLGDPDSGVRAAATALHRPGVPAAWRERCLADPFTRVNAARHVPLTAEQAVELIGSGESETRRAVAGNPHLPAEVVPLLLSVEDPVVRMALALSRHVDAKTRDGLLARVADQDAAGSIEARVALHWGSARPEWLLDLPLDERLAYLDCPHPVFRTVLADSRDLPEDAWKRLDKDPDLGVRRTAAQRPDTPAEVLETLVRDGGELFHQRPLLVEHPNFPRDRLRAFADDPDPRIQRVALEDPDLPADVLERLADTPALRHRVAAHPSITADLLDRLLTDPDPYVVDEAAANPRLELSRMEQLLDD